MVWVDKSILFGAFQVGEPDEFFLWLDLGLLIWKRIGTCIVGRLALLARRRRHRDAGGGGRSLHVRLIT